MYDGKIRENLIYRRTNALRSTVRSEKKKKKKSYTISSITIDCMYTRLFLKRTVSFRIKQELQTDDGPPDS